MSSYDDIPRKMRELDRMVAPLREFERLYGRDYQQIVSAIDSLQPAINRAREFEHHSYAASQLIRAHQDLSQMFSTHAQLNEISQAATILDPQWQDNIAAYKELTNQRSAAELALQTHYTIVAESALLAQDRLLSVPWETLGCATQMRKKEFASIRDQFTQLTDTYGTLIKSLNERDHFIASFPPIVSSGPPIEIFTSACVLDAISRQTTDNDYLEANSEIESSIEEEVVASLDELLLALNPDLRTMWLGAKGALRSCNPDRRRHVAFSLRELITHVLHTIAPNDDVMQWADDPSHFHDNRPTRKARVLFVCRGIDHGCFTNFVNADAKAGIELINLFQRGHELTVSFSDKQLQALVARTESLLRFLILISRSHK